MGVMRGHEEKQLTRKKKITDIHISKTDIESATPERADSVVSSHENLEFFNWMTIDYQIDSYFKNKQYPLMDLVSISSNACLKVLNSLVENFDSGIARNELHTAFQLC